MGSSTSKVASKAAAATGARKYPSGTPSVLNNATYSSPAPSQSTTNAPSRPSYAYGASQVRPDPREAPPTDAKTPQIDLDGRDPQFGARLSQLGAAMPVNQNKRDAFPTSTNPPQQGNNIFPSAQAATNPAILVVEARNRIGKVWQDESERLGRKSFAGRTLLSAKDIKEALRLRDESRKTSAEIETQMRLKPGVFETLARKDVVANVI